MLKLLFDFGMRGDALSTVQAALILTHSSSTIAQGTSNNSFWLNIAIETAMGSGFHRPSKPLAQRMAWQCCIVRDRMLSLAVRRPLQILPAHFSYTSRLLSDEEVTNYFLRLPTYPATTVRHLAQSFTAMCDLAVIITDAILLLYPPHRGALQMPGSLQEYRSWVDRCRDCKDKLAKWFVNMSLDFSPAVYAGDDQVMVHTNLLHFHY